MRARGMDRVGGQDERPAVVDQRGPRRSAEPPGGPAAAVRAVPPRIVVSDGPPDHRLRRRPRRSAGRMRRSPPAGPGGQTATGRIVAARGASPGRTRLCTTETRVVASPRRVPARRGGEDCPIVRRSLLMTRFLPAASGGTDRRRWQRDRRSLHRPRPRATPIGGRRSPSTSTRPSAGCGSAVADLPKAAMFDLRDRGYGSPFEQLVGSLISARTRDETTVEVCLRLFAGRRGRPSRSSTWTRPS